MNRTFKNGFDSCRVVATVWLGLFGVLVVPASAQLAAWDFSGENGGATSAAEVFDSKLDSTGTVTRGSGAAASAAVNSFRTTGFKNNGISLAETDYFQITLSAAPGYSLSIGTIDARFNGTDTFHAAPAGVTGQFAYSLDGSVFTLLGDPFVMTGTGAMPQLDVSAISALQNVPDAVTVTIRYFASGQTTTGGWGFYSGAAGQYGLAVGGTLTASLLPSLGLTVSPLDFAENSPSPSATGTVSIPTALTTDLPVMLFSSDVTETVVPVTVTIPAGSTSAGFAITAVDDPLADGPQMVDLTASATGYASARQAITVRDDGDVPPSLSPGAIAFVGFNADGNDDLAFVALTPIAATDAIFITDKAWNGLGLGEGGAFLGGEGVLTWSAPAGGVAAGTVITLNNLSIASRSASLGTLSASGSFNLGGDGETVYAYQGEAGKPTGFLAIIATQTNDATTGTGLDDSQIVHLTNHADVAAYTGSRCDQPGFAAYLAAIGNPAKWVVEDGTGDQHNNLLEPDLPFAQTAFTLASGAGYAAWAADNANSEAADADADGDGVPNGVEYLMGEPPFTFTPNPSVADGKITWPRRAGVNASYVVATSTDLIHWTPASSGVQDNGSSIEYTLPPSQGRVFVRLEVVAGP